MSKLPKHIEERFDEEFPLIKETGIEEAEGVFLTETDSEKVKSFIATILEEEKLKAFLLGYEKGNDVQIDWKYLNKEEQDKLINLIKEE